MTDAFLNPELIKAAASSTLGILSLMCVIIGLLALAFFRSAPVMARLTVFVLCFAGLAGFAAAVLHQQAPGIPEASRDFVIGRWEVEQNIGGWTGGTYFDYNPDGQFKGNQQEFVNGRGVRHEIQGTWDFRRLGPNEFRLVADVSTGQHLEKSFRIVDRNRIHNLDENYDAVRVPR